MTGTACDSYEYDENQTDCLNRFDFFSLRLFEKLRNNHLPAEKELGYEPLSSSNQPSRDNQITVDGSVYFGEES